MKWSDYTVGSLKIFAMKHNDLVKIPHPSKLKRAELEKELDKHFSWKGEKLQHKITGKIYTLLDETKKKETKKEEKKEEPKKEEPKKEEPKKEEKKVEKKVENEYFLIDYNEIISRETINKLVFREVFARIMTNTNESYNKTAEQKKKIIEKWKNASADEIVKLLITQNNLTKKQNDKRPDFFQKRKLLQDFGNVVKISSAEKNKLEKEGRLQS